MSTSRVEIVEQNLDLYLSGAARLPPRPPLPAGAPLTAGGVLPAGLAVQLFADQALSRALDVAARELKKTNRSYYTISSAGHENNVVLGELLRGSDPCFLHYRSGALMMARARKLPGEDPIMDTLLGVCASKDDPIAQGRHKVWGSRRLWVPPQTSTIASHLPKATGFAFALSRAKMLGIAGELPADAIVCCSFGDASTNHATALTGINAARYARRRGTAMPILFVCEDNDIGISVETPPRWIRDTYGEQKYLRYFEAEGELDQIYAIAHAAVDACRSSRGPVFLHLHCVRLWGHAGSDVETTYRTVQEIESIEARDPLLCNARRLVETGAATAAELAEIVATTRERVRAAAEQAARRPKLSTLAEIVAPLAPYDAERCRMVATAPADARLREALFFGQLPEHAKAPTKRTLAAQINAALADLMLQHKEIIVFGEDVGRKGGVYYVTAGLQAKFGLARVFDTLLDETSILGVAQGAAQAGLLPIPEIQYLAYIHNALDQVRGEACSLSFFSNGQFTNPMVIRVQGFAYQKGFGGHFHNDNSVGALRDIPGLVVAAPARGDDAARMLRGLLAMARENGRVCCFLEPIALYHEKDLYADGDNGWLFDYPPPGSGPAAAFLPGDVGLYGAQASDLLIVSYANGLRLSLRAARQLEQQYGLRARVLDLRWLNPLPFPQVELHARACGRVLVADECRATGGGVADALIARLAEGGFAGRLRSVRAADTYVPLGPAADVVLMSEEQIVAAARALCG
jgi:2-oxoisovalerate dehydrogenase E1 component